MNRLIIIDGHAILHRAFHAMPPLTTHDGTLVNAVYGFVAMMLKIVEDFKPSYLIVCFDRPKPTLKKQMYVGYQANRPKMDNELSPQIPIVHELLEYMGISIYEMDGYEADDIMGTIVKKILSEKDTKRKSEKEIQETIIVTGDRDILQLVNENVKVCMPVLGLNQVKVYGENEVKDKFGITPLQMIDYKALVGDQSDNYPGVPGIGPKTAKNLLTQFGTLENLYKHLDEVKNERIRKILSENSESAALSKKLATMITDAPIKVNFQKAKIRKWDSPDIMAKFEEMEFRSLIPRLMGKTENKKQITNNKEQKEENQKQQMSLF
ncbi:hypothetical protein A3D77_00740 [Candidatus Gottesmanbacteria bacterium RIFCSPHIGHO2_02_FULL_39_11]|uniref:5'-3' exonuclease domain-containing protein n=1 Tax=Candidatus Gottesmanbacteria bacterium RIFCSPHIGHO2_02_FULL_39_11 TaxID=1798382 RepID=A0A1F5ZMA1_9BACT|nr:MAG: hypothetical protein A3D77_00740 [Candidatus Gottesmanbacteria bacterium RIFCSPHIGHO2_02_FULL_39_11]